MGDGDGENDGRIPGRKGATGAALGVPMRAPRDVFTVALKTPTDDAVRAARREANRILYRTVQSRGLSPGMVDESFTEDGYMEATAASPGLSRYLRDRVNAGENVDALVANNLRRFVTRQQIKMDPDGFKLFQEAERALSTALKAGLFSVVSGLRRVVSAKGPRDAIRNETVLRLVPAPVDPALPPRGTADWSYELQPRPDWLGLLWRLRKRATVGVRAELVAMVRDVAAARRWDVVFKQLVDALKADGRGLVCDPQRPPPRVVPSQPNLLERIIDRIDGRSPSDFPRLETAMLSARGRGATKELRAALFVALCDVRHGAGVGVVRVEGQDKQVRDGDCDSAPALAACLGAPNDPMKKQTLHDHLDFIWEAIK